MKIFSKLSKFFAFLLSLIMLLQTYSSMACIVYVDDITCLCSDSIIFSASYYNKDKDGTVKLEGALGAYTMHFERFGQYSVEGPGSQSVCRIVENNSSNYDIQLGVTPEGGWNKWHVERPDGCSYWELIPQGAENRFERRIYIDRVPDSYAWVIYMTVSYPDKVIQQKIATVNFAPDVYGEIEDLVNFAIFTVIYSQLCKSDYWI